MACDSQSLSASAERTIVDLQNVVQLPEAQTPPDTTRTMTAFAQAAAVLHSPLPLSSCFTSAQQFAPASYCLNTSQPFGFNLPQPTYSGLGANSASPLSAKPGQNLMPAVGYAHPHITTPILGQSMLPSGGSMFAQLDSPHVAQNSEVSHTTTHYAALLRKPVVPCQRSITRPIVPKCKPSASVNEVAGDGKKYDATSAARGRSCSATASSGRKRAILCKQQQQATPFHFQPLPSAAPRILPAYAAQNGSFPSVGPCAAYPPVANNSLTAFLNPSTNTLHILPIGAIQQLAQFQQTLVNTTDSSSLLNTSVANVLASGVMANGCTATPPAAALHNSVDSAATVQMLAQAQAPVSELPSGDGTNQSQLRASTKQAQLNTYTPGSEKLSDASGETSTVGKSMQNHREVQEDSESQHFDSRSPKGGKNRSKTRKSAAGSRKSVKRIDEDESKQSASLSSLAHSPKSAEPIETAESKLSRGKPPKKISKSAAGKQRSENVDTATNDLAPSVEKKSGDSQRNSNSESQIEGEAADVQNTAEKKHVVDGFVIRELSGDRDAESSRQNEATQAVSVKPTIADSAKESENGVGNPPNTIHSVKVHCVFCFTNVEMRTDGDEEAVRRVRRLIELGVCSHRCKQKFLSRREKEKRRQLERNLSNVEVDGTAVVKADVPKRASKKNAQAVDRNSESVDEKVGTVRSEKTPPASTASVAPSHRSTTDTESIASHSIQCRSTPDLIANIKRSKVSPSTRVNSRDSKTKVKAKATRSRVVKNQQPIVDKKAVKRKRDTSSSESDEASSTSDEETVARRTRGRTNAKTVSGGKPVEPDLRRTRSQSQRPAPAITPAKQRGKTKPPPSPPKPARAVNTPIAFVSPSSPLLSPTSLSELSSSAFSLMSPASRPNNDDDDDVAAVKSSSDPSKWTVQQVFEFMSSRDWLTEYAPHFRDAEIDGSALALLRVDHLVGALRMKLGPALKLHDLVQRLKDRAATESFTEDCSPVRKHSDSDGELDVEEL